MKILACITFLYKEARLQYLKKVLASYSFMTCDIEVIVITDVTHNDKIKLIESVFPLQSSKFTVNIIAFPTLPNPWLLTWGHKEVFRSKFNNMEYTHFICSEDDLEIKQNNIDYWLKHREKLIETGFYPSFFRVEWNKVLDFWASTDLTSNIRLKESPILEVENGTYTYLNVINPYQGMFLYDRPLMNEHMQSDTFDILKYGHIESIELNPNWGGGGVAERANFGLTFEKVPTGFRSRNLINFDLKYRLLNYNSFIHHLPNNYADSLREDMHGQIKLNSIIRYD
jgi:hypothetical protein